MDIQTSGAAPERVDFSKIKTSIPIPNLIEVQKNSYERFLQMDLLPNEREDTGLQTVFSSVFPISDFRGVSELEFVDYAIGNWECKCGHLKGLHHLRTTCKNCGSTVITDPFHPGDVLCSKCGTYNANTPDFCNKCGDPVGLQLKYDVAECEERGMTYSAPLKVTMRLTIVDKDAETGNRSIRDIKEQEVFFGDVVLQLQPNRVPALVAEVGRVGVVGAALRTQHVAGMKRIGDDRVAAVLTGGAEVMQTFEVSALALPVTNGIIHKLKL